MSSKHYECPVNSIKDIGVCEKELLASRNHFDVIRDIKRDIKEEPIETKWLIENGVCDESRQEEGEDGKFNEPVSRISKPYLTHFDTKSSEYVFAADDQGIGQIKKEIKVENANEDYSESIEDLSVNNAELKMQTVKSEDDIDIVYEDIKPEMYRDKLSGNKSHEPSDSEAGLQQILVKEEHETFVKMDNDTRTEHSPTDWKNRQMINSKKKPYDCKYCLKKKSFESKQELHEKTQLDKIPYRCKLHSKSFIFKRKMKKYECKFCSKRFTKKSNFLVHERIHTGEKPFRCNLCSKCFAQSSYLFVHERTHTGEKPFRCNFCSKSFSQASNLLVHKSIHTEVKPFTCNVCSKSFAQRIHLLEHERVHTGEKPFHCNFCSKSYTSSSALKFHEKTHSREKPFQCKICLKLFYRKDTFERHVKTHKGEKPFQCNICLKSLSLKSSLRAHERIHTREKPSQ